jgi:hypothetical protein
LARMMQEPTSVGSAGGIISNMDTLDMLLNHD